MSSEKGSGELVRALDWKGAFWVAAGVPPLVLFSIGGIAGTTGKLAFLVWIISMIMGFLQSFTYAEIAGMFGNKSGGASVYGATAWLRYSKFIAPLSVWCNWFAWSPVLSLGCAIAAGYILNALFPIPLFVDTSPEVLTWLAHPANAGKVAADAIAAVTAAATPAIRTWELVGIPIPGLGTMHFNTTFVIGAILMLIMFWIQHRGIASQQAAINGWPLSCSCPCCWWGLCPSSREQSTPPMSPDLFRQLRVIPALMAHGASAAGHCFSVAFISRPGRPTVLKRPSVTPANSRTRRPTPSRQSSTRVLLCRLFFFLVPFAFQGVLGHAGMLAPGIVDGTGIAEALGNMVGGHPVVTQLFVILMILALFLAIMTAMAGSSRTLYQGSKDGWLPRYLTQVNSPRRTNSRHVDGLHLQLDFAGTCALTLRATSTCSQSQTWVTSSSTS